jgi:hypothetical protein
MLKLLKYEHIICPEHGEEANDAPKDQTPPPVAMPLRDCQGRLIVASGEDVCLSGGQYVVA